VTSIYFYTFHHDIELSKFFAKFDKLISPKELKKVKQEK
jgi:hypothetical protein